ncbi:HYR domain-containing protein [Gramella sp. GC03-9]|uniref:HYR domain-containing protein n=1 Tax=Christiangramia oceanisediminis TaxID=2920386 RepID=A0A9X2KX78_9FLAO|nr:LamG-like jellyroll fold domain-containing protein [Gramella oceanisediminis]MCP9198451.1 HYR domain-containing protein [Gramella oceanisediminis]
MHKTTFGPRIHYVLKFALLIFTLSSWTGAELFGQISISETVQPATCSDSSDGSIVISVSGGTGSYTYSWSGPNNFSSTDKNISNIAPGEYSLTVTDTGDSTSKTSTITVGYNDSEDPTITAPSNKTVNSSDDGTGDCTTTVDLGNPAISDNCEIDILVAYVNGTAINEETYDFTVGNTTVTWEVTDVAGNSSTATQTVTVIDNENPTITVPADITTDSNPDQCYATGINLGSENATDNCTIASITNDAPSQFPVGETIVTWTVTDEAGNSTTAIQRVTVEDNTAPKITAPANIATVTNSDSCFATNVNLGSETTSDNCNVASVSNDAPTEFPVGVTTVTWTVTDEAGNTATDTQTVTVTDETSPGITAPADLEVDADSDSCFATGIDLGTPSSSDNCDTPSVSNDAPTQFPLGETIVTWTAEDTAGNSTTVIQKITVSDNTAPEITAPADFTADADSDSCFATGLDLGTETVNDNCGVASVTNDAPAQFPLGETTVTWTVTDDSGNTATDIQVVTIVDNTLPVITVPGTITSTNDPGLCEAGVNITTPAASDNCSVTSPSGTRDDGLGLDEPYPVGTTIITWNVTDENGNAAAPVEQEIIVTDDEAPEVPALENITWGCEYTVEAPEANDNCDGIIIGNPNRSTTFTSSGSITWTFTDSAGNSSEVTQEITLTPIEIDENDITVVDVLCNGLATGEVEATATGGVAPLTYDWGSLGTGARKTDLPAGTYTVIVTDANGCEAEPVSVTITEPDTFIEVTSVNTTTGCVGENNGTATVTAQGGTGAYTYLWEDGQTTQTATGLAPGQHTVTITDANGCTKERTVTVSQPVLLEITGFLTTETTSFGSATGTATAQVSGGTPNYTFAWTGPDGTTYTGQTASGLAAGEYSVTVTDANGCTATETVIVVDSVEAIILPTSVCKDAEDLIRTSTFSVEGGSATGGSGEYEYSWDFGDGNGLQENIGPGPHEVKYNEIGDKQITLIVEDSEGRTFQQTIIQYVGGCFSNDCGSSDLGVGDFYIGLDDANGTPVTSANCNSSDSKFLYIKVPSNPKRYSLQVEIIYSIEDIETGEIVNDKLLGCFYEKEDVPDNAKTFELNYNCSDNIEIKGIYLTFQVNKERKCGASQGNGNNPKCYSTNNEATVSSPLYGVAFGSQLLCNGASNGTITSRASGGSGDYTFELFSVTDNQTVRVPQENNIFNQLPAGIYKVIVNDGQETFTTQEVEITEPSDPLQAETNHTNVTCFGGNDGTASVQATGGTPNYIYVWEDGQTGQTATNLAAGEYEVRIIDANGCEITEIVTIEQPAEIIANAGPDQVLGCGFSSTSLAAVPGTDENGDPNTGTWSIVNGPSGGSFVDVSDPVTRFSGNQGTYTLRWSADCGKTDDVKITISNCNTLDFDGVNDHVNFGNNYGMDEANSFTFEAWIKPKSNDGIRTILSKKDISNPSAGGFDLILNNGKPTFRGLSSNTSFTDETIGTSRWYHIAVTFNGADASLFVDGILMKTIGGGSNPGATDAPFLLGAVYDSSSPNNPKNFFHGWMEEVRIWSKALNAEQIRILMNQHLSLDSSPVRGQTIPTEATGLAWSDLDGYYPLVPGEVSNGVTRDMATNKINGKLVNITTTQKTTAPLPYISAANGSWRTKNSWKEPTVWDVPNSTGINGDTIYWNVAETSHNLKSAYRDIVLLGLVIKSGSNESSKINMEGSVNEVTGNELYVSHYLKLNGVIDLNGESQLVQPEGSELEVTSSGYVYRDQQGTRNSFNYNYWSSPVSTISTTANNSGFSLKNVLFDGSSSTPKDISFNGQYHWADAANYSGLTRISTYWLYTFRGVADDYSEWHRFSENTVLPAGTGYTMKGTRGWVPVSDRQNYTFKGKPNNGNISQNISPGQNLLIGNPYPSAIDANKFIEDNLDNFNGSVYYWDHFGPENSHYLVEYVGGYAVFNLSGGVEAATSSDARINNNNAVGSKTPGKFIPVGQAFFVNSIDATNASSIVFKNSHRAFRKESSGDSQFLSQEYPTKDNKQRDYQKDSRYKIRLNFKSPKGFLRQILVTADSKTTANFDIGYDAPLIDNFPEDMYWMINDREYVIQAVPNFNLNQVLPLGVKIAKEGEFEIELHKLENFTKEINIYIHDKKEDTYHNLLSGNFKVQSDAGTFDDRYELVFQKPQDEIVDKPVIPLPEDEWILVDYHKETDEIMVGNPDLLPIEMVELFSLGGQKIMTFNNVQTQKNVALPINRKLSSSVYIVRVYSKGKEQSKKIIISN